MRYLAQISNRDLDKISIWSSKNRYFERVSAVRRAVITARVGKGVGRELAYARDYGACGDTEPKMVKIRRDGGAQRLLSARKGT